MGTNISAIKRLCDFVAPVRIGCDGCPRGRARTDIDHITSGPDNRRTASRQIAQCGHHSGMMRRKQFDSARRSGSLACNVHEDKHARNPFHGTRCRLRVVERSFWPIAPRQRRSGRRQRWAPPQARRSFNRSPTCAAVAAACGYRPNASSAARSRAWSPETIPDRLRMASRRPHSVAAAVRRNRRDCCRRSQRRSGFGRR